MLAVVRELATHEETITIITTIKRTTHIIQQQQYHKQTKTVKACKTRSLVAGQLVRVVADHESYETSTHYCFSFADGTAVFLVCEERDNAVRMRFDVSGELSFVCAEKVVKEAWLCGAPLQFLFYTYPLSVGRVDIADATSLLPTVIPVADAEPVKLPTVIPAADAKANGSSAQSKKIDAAVQDILAELGVADGAEVCAEEVDNNIAIYFLEHAMGKTLRVARARLSRKRKRSVVRRQGGKVCGKKKRKTLAPEIAAETLAPEIAAEPSVAVARHVASKGERPVWDDHHKRCFVELWCAGKLTGLSIGCSCTAHSKGRLPCRRNVSFGKKNAALGEHDLRSKVFPEFKKRLLAWDAAGAELKGKRARDDHKALGGLLLCWYASDI